MRTTSSCARPSGAVSRPTHSSTSSCGPDRGQGNGDLNAALDALAEFRAELPPIDAVALVREGRDELEARGA